MSTLRITFHEADASQPARTIEAKPGDNLMKLAVKGDVSGVAADCGGTLTCATCHVMVREPWLAMLPVMKGDEASMLDFAACERQPGSRLSCQITLQAGMDGMQIDLPASQY